MLFYIVTRQAYYTYTLSYFDEERIHYCSCHEIIVVVVVVL